MCRSFIKPFAVNDGHATGPGHSVLPCLLSFPSAAQRDDVRWDVRLDYTEVYTEALLKDHSFFFFFLQKAYHPRENEFSHVPLLERSNSRKSTWTKQKIS